MKHFQRVLESGPHCSPAIARFFVEERRGESRALTASEDWRRAHTDPHHRLRGRSPRIALRLRSRAVWLARFFTGSIVSVACRAPSDFLVPPKPISNCVSPMCTCARHEYVSFECFTDGIEALPAPLRPAGLTTWLSREQPRPNRCRSRPATLMKMTAHALARFAAPAHGRAARAWAGLATRTFDASTCGGGASIASRRQGRREGGGRAAAAARRRAPRR